MLLSNSTDLNGKSIYSTQYTALNVHISVNNATNERSNLQIIEKYIFTFIDFLYCYKFKVNPRIMYASLNNSIILIYALLLKIVLRSKIMLAWRGFANIYGRTKKCPTHYVVHNHLTCNLQLK